MKQIIASIDGSAISDDVCQAAIWVAKRLQKPLLFVHTIEKETQPESSNLTGAIGLGARSALLEQMVQLEEQKGKIALQLGKELLSVAVETAKNAGIAQVDSKQRHGQLLENLQDLEKEALLMIVGRAGKQSQEHVGNIGSHIETLIRSTRTPLVLIPRHFSAAENFMLAYDGRVSADNAIDHIINHGLLKGLPCHLVAVKNNESGQQEKFTQAKERLVQAGFDVTEAFLEGAIFDVLAQYQQQNQIEMLVMGAFAHSKIRHFFLGSNTMRMIDSFNNPLILFR